MNPLIEVLCNEITKIKKMLTTTGTDYTATVTRVDGNTAYVQMSGSEISDTPVSMTINANVGDKVRVRVSAGKAWITGNDTAPPADNKQVIEIIENNSQGLIETEAKYSRIDQTIDDITLQVGEKMDSDMSNRASSISIDSGRIEFNSNTLVVNSSKFTLDQNGNATFGGTLDAAGGRFEGQISTLSNIGTYGTLIQMGSSASTPFSVESRNLDGARILVFDDLIWVQSEKVGESYKVTTIDADGCHPPSDLRLKEDITKIDPETAKHLLPVQFRFKGDDKTHYGFIAQDVQKVIPDVVDERTDGYLTLTYHELIAPLYALVQEQEDRISRLEARIELFEKGE